MAFGRIEQVGGGLWALELQAGRFVYGTQEAIEELRELILPQIEDDFEPPTVNNEVI